MNLKEAIARLLVITMCLSLFSSCVLAVEAESQEDTLIVAQSSEEAAPEKSAEDSTAEESTPDEMESDPKAMVEESSEADNPAEAAEKESTISEEMEPIKDSSAHPENRAEQEGLQQQSTGGHTQEDAVAWAENQEGSTYAGNYGYQCVDLIREYYAYLGQERPTGNADDYLNDRKGHKPDGWEIHYGSDGIQPGDILVWTGGENGHVAIVVETGSYSCTVMQQNADGNGDRMTDGSKGSFGTWSYSKISGYIHPDFASPNQNIISGRCGKNATWNYDVEKHTLTISGKGKVRISDNEDDKYYIWKDLHAVFEEEVERTGTIEKIKLVVNEGITDLSIEGAEGYKSLKFPKSLKVLSSLGGSELPSTFIIPKSVTSIKDDCLFFNVSAFKVEKGNPKYSAKDGVLFNKDKTVLIRYPWEKKGKRYSIPNTVRKIGCNAFDPTYLKELIIPSSVKTIGRDAFWYCYYKLYFQGLPPKMNDIFEEEMDEAVIYYPKRYKKQWEARIKEFKSCGIKVKSWKG